VLGAQKEVPGLQPPTPHSRPLIQGVTLSSQAYIPHIPFILIFVVIIFVGSNLTDMNT